MLELDLDEEINELGKNMAKAIEKKIRKQDLTLVGIRIRGN
jgi:hypothetical protein